jgi:hypothetical protein
MRILLIGMLLLIVSGCSEQGFLSETHTSRYDAMEKNMRTIEVEGCEYLVYSYSAGYGGYGFMAHKGNCKNPIHRNVIEYEKETVQRTH